MTIAPRTVDEVYQSLKDRLLKIGGLTNFTPTSFNSVWTNAFSEEFRETEIRVLASQLNGWIDYSGGPISSDDLNRLGIEDSVTPQELNEILNNAALDELVKIVGVTRDEGDRADGSVTFTTQSAATTIPAGTPIGTQPDSSGDFYQFVTDYEVATDVGETEVSVDITASSVGNDYNVGSGTITYLPDPPAGVTGVVNNLSTGGGKDRESNNELRKRAKNAIFENSGGGTVQGIIGYVESELEGVDEVEVTELFEGDTTHGGYPHSHVIVDFDDNTNTRGEVMQKIDESRPVSVEHILVTPKTVPVGVDVTLVGDDIDTTEVEERISNYIYGLGMADDVVYNKIIQRIFNADEDIENIVSIDLYIDGETQYWDSTKNPYLLNKGEIMVDDGITEVTGTLSGNTHTFVEDVDYQEWNMSAGTTATPHDSIDWSLAGDNPDTYIGLTKTIDFNPDLQTYFVDFALMADGITAVEELDSQGNVITTFAEGVDYDEFDNDGDGNVESINWLDGGATPIDGNEFRVTYDAGSAFNVTYMVESNTDIPIDKTDKPDAGPINVSVQ